MYRNVCLSPVRGWNLLLLQQCPVDCLEERVGHYLDKPGLSVASEPVSWVLVQEALEDGEHYIWCTDQVMTVKYRCTKLVLTVHYRCTELVITVMYRRTEQVITIHYK